jgi:hypothetical protein
MSFKICAEIAKKVQNGVSRIPALVAHGAGLHGVAEIKEKIEIAGNAAPCYEVGEDDHQLVRALAAEGALAARFAVRGRRCGLRQSDGTRRGVGCMQQC